MSKSELKLFRRFTDINEVKAISSVLNDHGIEFKITIPSSPLNSSFGHINEHFIELYLLENDFDQVEIILRDSAKENSLNVTSDYYLFQLSDEELSDILAKPHDWNELDIEIASRILAERRLNSQTQTTGSTPSETPVSDNSKGSQRGQTLVLLVVAILVSIYYFYNPNLVSSEELILVTGKIADQPKYYDSHEGLPYVRLNLRNHDASFKIDCCPLSKMVLENVLNIGDENEVGLYVLRSEWRKNKGKIIEVCSLSMNGTLLLTLDEFNDCQKSQWKIFVFFISLFLILLIFRRRNKKVA